MPFVGGKWVEPKKRRPPSRGQTGNPLVDNPTVRRAIAKNGGRGPIGDALAVGGKWALTPLSVMLEGVNAGSTGAGLAAGGVRNFVTGNFDKAGEAFADLIGQGVAGGIVRAARGEKENIFVPVRTGTQYNNVWKGLGLDSDQIAPGGVLDTLKSSTLLSLVDEDLARGTADFVGSVITDPWTFTPIAPVSRMKQALAATEGLQEAIVASRQAAAAARQQAMKGVRRGPDQTDGILRTPDPPIVPSLSPATPGVTAAGRAGGIQPSGLTPLERWQLQTGGIGRTVTTPTGAVIRADRQVPIGELSTVARNVESAAATGIPDTTTAFGSVLNEISARAAARSAEVMAQRGPNALGREVRWFGKDLGQLPTASGLVDDALRYAAPGSIRRRGYNAYKSAGASPATLPAARKKVRNAVTRYGAYGSKSAPAAAGIWEAGQTSRRWKDRLEDAYDKEYRLTAKDFIARKNQSDDALRAADEGTDWAGTKYSVEDVADAVTIEAGLPRYVRWLVDQGDERLDGLTSQQVADLAYNDFREVLRTNWGRSIPERNAVVANFAQDVNRTRRLLDQMNVAELQQGLIRGQRDYYIPQAIASKNRRNRKSVNFYDRRSRAAGGNPSRTYGDDVYERKDVNTEKSYANDPRTTAASMHEANIDNFMLYLRSDQEGGMGVLPELNFMNILRMRQRQHARLMAAQSVTRALAGRYGKTLDLESSRKAENVYRRLEAAEAALADAKARYAELRGPRATREALMEQNEKIKAATEEVNALRVEAAKIPSPEEEAALALLREAENAKIADDPEVAAALEELSGARAAKKPRPTNNEDFDLQRLLALRKTMERRGMGQAALLEIDKRIAAKLVDDPVTQMSKFLGRGAAQREVRRLERKLGKEMRELHRAEGRILNTQSSDPIKAADEVYGLLDSIVRADQTLQRALTQREVALQRTLAGKGVSGKSKRSTSGVGRGGLREKQTQFVERSRERLQELERQLFAMLEVDTADQIARIQVIKGTLDEARTELQAIDKVLANTEKSLNGQIIAAEKAVAAARSAAKVRRSAEITARRKAARSATRARKSDPPKTNELADAEKALEALKAERESIRSARKRMTGTADQFRSVGKKIEQANVRAKKADAALRDLRRQESRLMQVPGERISQAEYDRLVGDIGNTWKQLGDKLHYEFTIVDPANKQAIDRMLGQLFGRVGNERNLLETAPIMREMTSIWKRLTLATTGYTLRNALGDFIAMIMGGFTNPESLAVSFRAFRRTSDGAYKHTGRIGAGYGNMTYEGLREEIFLQQIRQAGFAGSDVKSVLANVKKRKLHLQVLPNRINNGVIALHLPSAPGKGHYTNSLYRLNESRENWVRTAMYLEKRRQGFDPVAAQTETMKWLFDYGDVAPLVASLRRFWIPFIVWPSKMYPRVIEAYMTNTRVFAWYYQFAQNMQASAERKYGEAYDLSSQSPIEVTSMFGVPLPDFLGGAFGSNGLPFVYSGRNAVPFAVVDEYSPAYAPVAENLPAPLRVPLSMGAALTSSVNPFVSTAAQIAGYSPRDRAMKRGEWKAASMVTTRAAQLSNALNLTTEDPDGTERIFGTIPYDPMRKGSSGGYYPAMGSAWRYLIDLYPPLKQAENYAGAVGLGGVLGADDYDAARALQRGGRMVSGLDVRPIDMAEEQARAREYGR